MVIRLRADYDQMGAINAKIEHNRLIAWPNGRICDWASE